MSGIAFGLAALVAVGGLGFAAGRRSVEGSNPTSTAPGGGQGAAGGFGGQRQGQGQGGQRQGQGGQDGFSGQQAPNGFGGGQDGFGGQQAPEIDGFGEQQTPDNDGFGGQRQGRGGQGGFSGQQAPEEPGSPQITGALPGPDEDAASSSAAGRPAAVGSARAQQAPDADPAQAQDSGQGGQGGEGFPGRGQGFPGGFGGGGIEGVVTGIGDIGITVRTAQGEPLQFVIDDSTSFVREMITDPTSLAAGESVRVQFPLPQFNDGQALEPAPGSDIATLVTVLRPGAELDQGFGGGPGEAGGQGQGQGGGQRRGGGQGFPGGFGRFGAQGMVVAVADGSLILDLANGETQLIATDAATRFVREEDMDPATLQVGDAVRIQVPRGGFDGGRQQAQSEGPRVASQVTVVPAAQ